MANPRNRVLGWSKQTYDFLMKMVGQPGTGVIMVDGIEVYIGPIEDPFWRSCVPSFRRARPEELPSGYADGYAYSTLVIDMRSYLPYLEGVFRSLGGKLVHREIKSMAEVLDDVEVVVNCTGLASRSLLGDNTVYPIRGQIVRVSLPPNPRFIWDENEERPFTYIVPRLTDCILGGTTDANEWDVRPNPAVAADIIRRCTELDPQIESCRVLEHLVGLRPARPAIRLEAEPQSTGKLIVHNYGHGGSGVTVSWGCADEVAAIVTHYEEDRTQPLLYWPQMEPLRIA
jgi:D-amino-acid oxidase